MGTVRDVDMEIPQHEVIKAGGMGLGYAVNSMDGSRQVCIVLSADTDEGRLALSHTIDREDVEPICAALRLLKDRIGVDQWPSEGLYDRQ